MVGGCFKIVGGLVVLALVAVIGVAVFGGSDGSGSSGGSGNSGGSSSPAATEEAEPIEYQDVDINVLFDTLKSNALNAKNTYEGTPVRVTGVLTNIDASGDYFNIGNGDEYSFDSIQCYIKNDETLDKIAASSKGDTLTVCGTMSSVGEVLGYSMNVDYIE